MQGAKVAQESSPAAQGRDWDGKAGHYLFLPSQEMCIPALHFG